MTQEQRLNPTNRAQIIAADATAERTEATQAFLREQISWTKALQEQQAKRHRHAAPELRVGDRVMLDAWYIKTSRPNAGLDHKKLGPYTIKRSINKAAYELDLPPSMKIYPVFHPWLLHLANDEPLPGQVVPLPPLTEVNEEEGTGAYETTRVVASKISQRRKDPVTGQKCQGSGTGSLIFGKVLISMNKMWHEEGKFFGMPEVYLIISRNYISGPHKVLAPSIVPRNRKVR